MNFLDYYNILEEAVAMRSIPHLDQMKPEELFNLLDTQSPDEWEVSEKHDGSNISFGLDETNNIFTKSKKGKPVNNPAEYVRIADETKNTIMLDFARFLDALQKEEEKFKLYFEKLKKDKIVIKELQNNGIEDVTKIRFFGEILGSSKPNIIAYSADIIGKGIVVVFGCQLDDNTIKGKDISTTVAGKKIMKGIVSYFKGQIGEWKIQYKTEVELSIAHKYRNALQQFLDKYGEALKNRKRDPTSLANKAAAKEKFVQISKFFKKKLLGQISNVKSALGGEEVEGVIIRNIKNGAIAKVVDLDNFSMRRVAAWSGIDFLSSSRKELYKKIQDAILKNADVFILPAKQQEKLQNALEERGKMFNSIEDILAVFYQDASNEVQFEAADKTLEAIKVILQEHLAKVEQARDLVKNSNDEKFIKDTETAIKLEKDKTNNFLQKLEDIVHRNENPYIEIIKFMLGPKTIDELTTQFLKK